MATAWRLTLIGAILLISGAHASAEITEENRAAAWKKLQRLLAGHRSTDTLELPQYDGDWLVSPPDTASVFQVKIDEKARSATLVLSNGLITRTFHTVVNPVCYSLRHEAAGVEFLRSIKPEARLIIDGKKVAVGGMVLPARANGTKGPHRGGRTVANYFLPDWLEELVPDGNAFCLTGIHTSKPEAWLHWVPMESNSHAPWPPKGLRLSMDYEAPDTLENLEGLKVTVHYEIYDGLPVIGKWLSFTNGGTTPITLERTLIEELAFADEWANKVFVESEYNHFHAIPLRWSVDPEFTTDSGPVFTERMSDYRLRYWGQSELDSAGIKMGASNGPEWEGEYRSRSLMKVEYPRGPAKTLAAAESWSTFKSWLLLQDSMDEERKGLARRKLYRTLFPWAQENLVYMHILRDDSQSIRTAVDQCAAAGFDMVVLTFGSGFNMMSTDPEYIARIKADFDYAHSKGIKTGAYILFCSSRSYGDGEHDAGPSAYGRSLCLGSAFAEQYFEQVIDFMKSVGQDCIETDGPYHGYRCERTDHPLHDGVDDSWRVNWEQQAKFYRLCMKEGVYIISPDWYYASGNRKVPMGYKEANWTLPRRQQALVARQNIYDGTWWRTPSMCYHALPLTSVYGGGPESTMEPLSEHLDAYDRVLAQYFGMGIMACYRGFRLYDTEETKSVVKRWVDFYREHQAILDSDIIHVRRPDGRNLDCMMHANASLDEKGLAFIWNPTNERFTGHFELPLYYTGLTNTANVSERDGPAKTYKLDREYRITVPVDLPAQGYTWLVIG